MTHTYTLYLFTENPYLKELYHNRAKEFDEKNEKNENAGLDLYVPSTLEASQTGTVYFLDHQVICRMTKMTKTHDHNNNNNNDNEHSVSYYLYPRSSLSKTPFRLANSVGIIDAGYRGNIIAALDYIRGYPYTLEMGQRIVQICSPTLEPFRLVVCDSKEDPRLDIATIRSTGGFGSSGK